MRNVAGLWRSLVCSVVISGTMSVGAAHAQFHDPQVDLQYQSGANRTLNIHILPAFERVMSREERRLLGETRIAFPRNVDMLHAIAGMRQGRRIIEISTGFLAANDVVGDAAITTEKHGLHDEYYEYLAYVVDAVAQNSRRLLKGKTVRRIQNFTEYIGWLNGRAQRFQESDYYQNSRMTVLIEGLAFVLAHEIGHHVLGHTEVRADSKREQRQREAEADAYAVRLAIDAGFSPVAAVPVFLFFATAESIRDDDPALSSHPLALCRVANFMEEGLDGLMDDPAFRDYLRTNPGAQSFPDNWRAQLNDMRREAECG